MAKKILLVVVIVLVALVVLIAAQPDTFQVQRTATMKAPADKIYPHIADFHEWAAWSPWEKLDPAMKKTYEGTTAQKGASYAWQGNDKVGEGRMTLTDVTPPNKVGIKLEFIKPFAATNDTTFVLTAKGDTTDVTWTMAGHNNFLSKAFHLVMDMDKMIGGDFDKGLAGLKTIVEK